MDHGWREEIIERDGWRTEGEQMAMLSCEDGQAARRPEWRTGRELKENNFSPMRSSPPCTPTSHYFSPCVASENHPEARSSPGWLTPKRSPCSWHAANNLSLLKETKLLERSTCTPPPAPSPGLLPCQCWSTHLHMPSAAWHEEPQTYLERLQAPLAPTQIFSKVRQQNVFVLLSSRVKVFWTAALCSTCCMCGPSQTDPGTVSYNHISIPARTAHIRQNGNPSTWLESWLKRFGSDLADVSLFQRKFNC